MTSAPINRPNADDSESRRIQKAMLKNLSNQATTNAGVQRDLKGVQRGHQEIKTLMEQQEFRHEQALISVKDLSGQDNEVLLAKLNTIDRKLDQILESQNGKQGLHAGQIDLMKLLAYQKDEEI